MKCLIFLSILIVMASTVADPIALIDVARYTRSNQFVLSSTTATQRLLPDSVQQQQARDYLRDFFAVWRHDYLQSHQQQARIQHNLQSARQTLLDSTLYASNFRAYPVSVLSALFTEWQHAVLAEQHAAIIIRETNVRVLPSVMPMFWDYKKAGNGYPFDMNQVQKLWVGHPVAVLEYTADWHWAFVVFDRGLGWIDTRDMAMVSPHFMRDYRQHSFAAIIQEGIALDDHQHFLLDSRIGQIFPLDHGRLLVPVAGFAQEAHSVAVTVPASVWRRFPWSMTPQHALQIISQMLGESYDWGGYYNLRDCSLSMLSFFTPFGRMLPRGSDQQKAMGHYINLTNKSRLYKQQLLRSQGKPFLTLVGLEGHVMLYLGTYHGNSYVFQNSWGLHAHQKGHAGRVIIGKAVITPLTLGERVPGVYKPQWSSIEGITLLNSISGNR